MNKPSHPVISPDGGSVAYEADAHAWAIDQAQHVRTGRWDEIDWINAAEDMAVMAVAERLLAWDAILNEPFECKT